MTESTPPKGRTATATADALHKIRVDVSANYVGEQSKPDEGHYAFSYTIT
ncbi:MAG: hypothetical protein JNL55_21510, partial [Steroidobacter sp.]|nr:hypothetical protein [Steroidobacter sp.]